MKKTLHKSSRAGSLGLLVEPFGSKSLVRKLTFELGYGICAVLMVSDKEKTVL